MGTAIAQEETRYTDHDFERMAKGNIVPKDRYSLRVDDVKETIAETKGTDGIEFKWTITDGPYKNEYFTDTLWLTDSNKRRTHFFQAKLGILVRNAEGVYVRNPQMNDWRDVIGVEVDGDVEIEEYTRKNKTTGQKNRLAMFGLYRKGEDAAKPSVAANGNGQADAPASRPAVKIPDDL